MDPNNYPVQPQQPQQPFEPPTPLTNPYGQQPPQPYGAPQQNSGYQQPSQPAQFVDPRAATMPPNPQPVPNQQPIGMPQFSPLTAPATKPKRNIKPMLGIALAVVILIVGASVALLGNKKDGQSSQNGNTKGNQVAATSLSDYSKVCNSNVITSAAAYEGTAPHPIALFEGSLSGSDSYVTSSVYLGEETWTPKSTEFDKTQLVGCFTKKSTTGTGRKCELLDSDDNKFEIEQFNVVYNLSIYEAKTGKKLGDREVSGPASTCPFFATYNKDDPKLYGDPDEGSTLNAVKEFVTK